MKIGTTLLVLLSALLLSPATAYGPTTPKRARSTRSERVSGSDNCVDGHGGSRVSSGRWLR
jgi:hypothetical protein